MDDSDQDFVDLCSKLLKRVRRKPGDTGEQRSAEHPSSTQAIAAGDASKRTREKKDNVSGQKKGSSTSLVSTTQSTFSCTVTGAKPASAISYDVQLEPKPTEASGSIGLCSVTNGSELGSELLRQPPSAEEIAERGLRAKTKVLLRMQQFKRVSPQKLMHCEKSRQAFTATANGSVAPLLAQVPSSSKLSADTPDTEDTDEAIALRLQQELDKEMAGAGQPSVDLEDGGLYFCQLCNRDLSNMSPGGRMQHINRCLDKSEESSTSVPAPPPSVPECPICGKKFKSQKTRSAHLKRCSVDMGVSPVVLLQAVQRQAAETLSDSTAGQPPATGGSKRKVPLEQQGLPARKKPRKKAPPLDDDTMVALALSSSLLEQERERERELQREMEVERVILIQSAGVPSGSLNPQFTWRGDTGKGKGKKMKRRPPRPPALLVAQDAETTLRKLQDRVAALLLRARAPSPPTPTHSPSKLPDRSMGAPLWQKSALPDGGPRCLLEFYTTELRDFTLPSQSAKRPARQGTPLSTAQRFSQPSSGSTASQTSSTMGNQALKDLMELADEGMTLTQLGYTTVAAAGAPSRDRESRAAADLHLHGFFHSDPPEDQADLCQSGFIPDAAYTDRADPQGNTRRRRSEHPGADTSRDDQKTAALSRLASDLSSLVNNPQLSDVQLQVDTGEVYFAHSFMLYTRCPLLAQMVHESGFGVKEEGMPYAQRVLLGDVPGQAVYTLLQYLYTAHCPITPSLLTHLQELASRFDLEEMQRMCTVTACETETQGDSEGEAWEDYPAQQCRARAEEARRDQAFQELLRSMWIEEDEDEDSDEGTKEVIGLKGDLNYVIWAGGDRDEDEDVINEEEMEEIYEFAATQRKREREKDRREKDEEEDEEEEEDEDEEEEDDQQEERGRIVFETEEEHEMAEPNISEPSVTLVSKESESHSSSQPGPDQCLDLDSCLNPDPCLDPEACLDLNPDPCLDLNPDPCLNADPCLDRSYSRLFSDSWGDHEDDPVSPPLYTSQSPQSQTSHSQHQPRLAPKPSSPSSSSSSSSSTRPSRSRGAGGHSQRQSERSHSQSSTSEVIDLSSSPPSASILPVPGVSPWAASRDEGGTYRDDTAGLGKGNTAPEVKVPPPGHSPKRESSCPRSVPLSQASPRSRRQPELIVLSDSSDDVEGSDAPASPSPVSPPSLGPMDNNNLRSYTQIKGQLHPEPDRRPSAGVHLESCGSDRGSTSPLPTSLDPDRPGSGSGAGSGAADSDQALLDCSPEVSWLIPATPVQPSKSSSSTQTLSSMRRTRLFHKASSSSSSSSASVFSPPASLLKDTPQTSEVSSCPPPRVSTRTAQAESTVSGQKSDSSRPNHGVGHPSDSVNSRDRPLEFSVPTSQPRRSRPPSTSPSEGNSIQGTLRHHQAQPQSSTPLHTGVPARPALTLASPLRRDRGFSQSLGRDVAFGSFHLSLAEPVDSPGPRGPPRETECSSSSTDWRKTNSDRAKKRGMSHESEKGMGTDEREEEGVVSENEGREDEEDCMAMKEEVGEVEVSPSSFQESYLAMDEPPMAFDDSWGLNGAADGDGDPRVCFSLRLESSSGGASPRDRRHGDGEVAGSSSWSLSLSRPPPPPPPTRAMASSQTNYVSLSPPSAHFSSPAPQDHGTRTAYPEVNSVLLDPKNWDEWEEKETEEEPLPLSQRVNSMAPAAVQRAAQLKTPVSSRNKDLGPRGPITPMPGFSDMDTPDLKNKLNRYGVRPLPKRQMILKLKQIHQYTHQVVSSESEDEAPCLGLPAQARPLPKATSRPVSCAQTGRFKQPVAPPTVSPVKRTSEEEEPLSASQGSSTSSTAPSEDVERSNPELCLSSSDDDSDSDVTPSQATSRLQDSLKAVQSFILSSAELYTKVLQYEPLVLSTLQAQLKAAGIKLGTGKLLDYLDSQCITFTTAKPGGTAPSRRRARGRGRGRGRGAGGDRGTKRGAATMID